MTHFKSAQNTVVLHLKTLLLFIFVSNFSFSQAQTFKKDVGIFNFEEDIIDYGTIQQNDNGLKTFKFTNSGTAPIVISNIKTTCGCTVPYYFKTPILPGKSSTINIKYATNRVGKFSKSIMVISNADTPQKRLQIKGNIIYKNTVTLK
ncbi:uncharacterized protein DUF1573 [Jejuia pallidilutea]|uniref:Uncharacterized protein DUF1573 n=1 Tax=Jejuia pallidilutea TaxID=504487 RepID=A0A362XAA8_9FLAO|nr:DUF1573 domain-containing protein [Jejuia pallidilutea]PQV47251.1 uncharacterized protein DUF1573 [Jejuia pallidilutea]